MTTVKDIARILANRYKLSNVEAEIFMQVMVEVINDGLLKDRQVKIKGFGTFKIQTVKERSSVNVNTGEKVIIAEHDKITFTPDTVMKDLVNKPFAQFETVMVEDGSPLLDDTVDDKSNVVADTEDAVEPVVVDDESTSEEVTLSVKTEDANLPNIAATEQETTALEKDDVVDKEKIEKEDGDANSARKASDDVNPDLNGNSTERQEIANTEEFTTKTEAQTKEEYQEEVGIDNSTPDNNPTENCERQYPHCRNIFIYYGILINVIVAIIAFTLGYISSSEKWFVEEETKVVAPKPATKVRKKVKKPQQHTKQTVAVDSAQNRANVTDKVEKSKIIDKEDKEEKSSKKEEDKDLSALHAYDNDIRIKTGAYYIMGTEKTITVKAGQTMASISRTYLGEGMECYIEALNGKKEVKQGDRIKIPQLKLKRAVNRNK